jgi:hypothetical protein
LPVHQPHKIGEKQKGKTEYSEKFDDISEK